MLKTWTLPARSALACVVLLISSPTIRAGATARACVQNIQLSCSTSCTRVTITLDGDTRYRDARLNNPDRIYLDISDSTLSSALPNRTIPVRDGLLKKVRVSQNGSSTVRVVLDLSADSDYSVSDLQNPFRIVVDLRGRAGVAPKLVQSTESAGHRLVPVDQDHASERVHGAGRVAGEAQEPLSLHAENGPGSSARMAGRKTPSFPPEVAGPRPSSSKEPETPAPSSSSEVAGAQPGDEDSSGSGLVAPLVRSRVSHPAPPPGSEKPLTITGTLSAGFYSAYTRGGGNDSQNISFAPVSAEFDIRGYYLTPDLVDYWIQPELISGAQASDAGFEGGNGVRMRVSVLRRQVLPVTFRYSNVQLKDVYFGSLSQLSTYTRKNRNKDMGVTAGLKHKGLPTATVDWGTSSVNSQSGLAMVPDYNSHSNHLNLDCTYERWGWDFRGFGGGQHQTSDLFAPVNEGTDTSPLRQKVLQSQGSAKRNLLQDSELYLDGGSQSTANLLLNQSINLTTRYANANLRMFQRRRWKSSFHAGYTSNIAGLLFTRLVSGLGGNGSVAPEPSALSPFQHTISYLNLNGLTTVELPHGFGLYSSMDRTAVLTGEESTLSSKYLTTAGGVTYSGTFRWGSLSGQYGRSFGIGSITGQTGRIEGQNYVVTAQPGKWDRVQFNATVRGTDQRVTNAQPGRDHSFASDGSVGVRLFGQFRTRLGGGWQQSTFVNSGTDFHLEGYSALAGIEHPRFQLNASLNSNVGNSLQAYGDLFSGIGLGSALLTPVHLIPSDFRGITATLHAIPIRRLELSALWTRSIQHLEGVVANDFEIIDAFASFHFRRLEFRAGYFRSNQIYSSYLATYPETERGRFYVRVSRTVRFF